MNRRNFLATAAAFAGSLGAFDAAIAQSASMRPIRMIVPFTPGGGTDPYARLTAEHMAKTLGRAIIVEHKPGGSGISVLSLLRRRRQTAS